MVSIGTLDLSFDRCLVFKEGLYKVILELTCKNDNLIYTCNPKYLQDYENGKIFMTEWQQPIGLENVVLFEDRKISMELTKKLLAYPVYMHATLLKFDEDKRNGFVDDAFIVFAHGKIHLHPKKRLFDQSKSILNTKYRSKLRFMSLLDNELVQAVLGWLDVGVEMNFTQHGVYEIESDSGTDSEVASMLSLCSNLKDENEQETQSQDEDQNNPEPSCRRTYGSQIKLNFNLPDLNAIKDILPQYYALSNEIPTTTDNRESVLSHVPIIEPETPKFNTWQQQHPNSKIDAGNMATVLYHQSMDIERHIKTTQQMAEHITKLNNQIERLKHEKSQLFTKLYYAGEDLDMNDTDENSNEHKQLVTMKRMLAAESMEKNELQERVNDLQNDIIQKNEVHVLYLELQKAHEQQQTALQDAQGKITKTKLLEKTCRDQEKVIETLEKELGLKGNGNGVKLECLTKNVTAVKKSFQNVDDKLSLMSELEHAQNTISVLKNQIDHNTKTWIQEKSLLERAAIGCPAVNLRPALRSSRRYLIDNESYLHRNWTPIKCDDRDIHKYSYHLGHRGGGPTRRRQNSYHL